jgi:hypothetical protein
MRHCRVTIESLPGSPYIPFTAGEGASPFVAESGQIAIPAAAMKTCLDTIAKRLHDRSQRLRFTVDADVLLTRPDGEPLTFDDAEIVAFTAFATPSLGAFKRRAAKGQ